MGKKIKSHICLPSFSLLSFLYWHRFSLLAKISMPAILISSPCLPLLPLPVFLLFLYTYALVVVGECSKHSRACVCHKNTHGGGSSNRLWESVFILHSTTASEYRSDLHLKLVFAVHSHVRAHAAYHSTGMSEIQ